MVKQRFEDFWLASKSINQQIFYKPKKGFSHVYLFEDVDFIGNCCEGMCISGNYNCRDESMSVTFYLKNVGPVKRFCFNKEHGAAGWFHEHVLRQDSDALLNNLPYAIPRPDLEGLSPEEVWRKICGEATVSHTDRFSDPQEWCK